MVYQSAPLGTSGNQQSVSRRVQSSGTVRQRDDANQLQTVWTAFRMQNAIVALLNMLAVKTPIIDADAIRGTACRALVGLARDDTVRQILGKLPVFTKGQLQQLTREPILVDNLAHHAAFSRYAFELIRRVCADVGQLVPLGTDISIERLRKADIAACTPIVYNELELLYLIHQHLLAKKLPDTAHCLLRELKSKLPPLGFDSLANQGNVPLKTAHELPPCPVSADEPQPSLNDTLNSQRTPNRVVVRRSRPISAAATGSGLPLARNSELDGPTLPSRIANLNGPKATPFCTMSPQKSLSETPTTSGENRPRLMRTVAAFASPQIPAVQRIADIQRSGTTNIVNPQNNTPVPPTPPSTLTGAPATSNGAIVNATPQTMATLFGFGAREAGWPRAAIPKKPTQDVSLERIVTEYLRKQHALCTNPLRTCPPFSLFEYVLSL